MFKKSYIHYAIFILIALGALTLVVLLLRSRYTSQYNTVLSIGDTKITVAVADTPAAQDHGLSDTLSLPANSGMLFVFDTPGSYGFWMKDMHYPLDFIWIDSSMNVVGITPNVAADSYPQIFYPPQPVTYVLEVNTNFSTTHNIREGEKFILGK